jgi:hypothetical protein
MSTGNMNIAKAGEATQFGRGQDNTKGGRPKSIYTIIKNKGFGSDDIRLAFSELAFYTLEELSETKADKTTPIIARIIANQFMIAFERSDWAKVKDIIEHVIGKPLQALNQTIIEPTREEREKRILDLISKTKILEAE